MFRLIQVAVPVPFLDVLTYRVGDDGIVPPAGARVRVPLGTRDVTGCVVGPTRDTEAPPRSTIKDVIEVLDEHPFVPGEVLRLALWTAEYYACGPGDAVAAAMPPGVWGNTRSFKTVRVASLSAQGQDVAGSFATAGSTPVHKVRLAARQREALTLLKGAPDGLETGELARRGITSATLTRLRAAGLIAVQRRRADRDPFADGSLDREGEQHSSIRATEAFKLTDEQDRALSRLAAKVADAAFGVALLHGVTGSGKTEIYLRLAQEVQRLGKRTIVLVPEIALTPAVASAFRIIFGARVAIQHSGLSNGERHDQWHRIREGAVDVVVGTRSAVFAPLERIGLIVVDEEHDSSYKQEESPRYHGRDVAIMRGKQNGALVVLGSATPSLESYQNARQGRYELVTLARRVGDRSLAAVRIVDMRAEYAVHGPDVVLSDPLRTALAERLSRREQVLVLLNRRGFAVAVLCRQCGDTLECPNCSVSLTVHRAAKRARCHYCDHSMPVPVRCRQCGGPYLEHVGFGTERVESEIRAAFPGARVARLDRDTVRRRGAAQTLLVGIARGELDVLVGTQMIAKGHDFPNVTLVGVISADVGLGLADFRAAERTFQLLTQVAGRAGRGELTGETIVQTLNPTHYSIQHACRQDYAAFFDEEIKFRQAMRYPPTVALINTVVRGSSQRQAMRDAANLVATLRASASSFRVLGPAPAPLSRLKGEHRAQVFSKGAGRRVMRQRLLAAVAALPNLRRRVTIDVDPVSVL